MDIDVLRLEQRRKAVCACLTRWGVTFQREPARIVAVTSPRGQNTRRFKVYDCMLIGPGSASVCAPIACSAQAFLPDMYTMLHEMDWFPALGVVGQTFEHWRTAGLAREKLAYPDEYSEFEDVEFAQEAWDKWQQVQQHIQHFCRQVQASSEEQRGFLWEELCRAATE